MMRWRYEDGGPAKPEYATAKIAVWWDMKDCPIPEGYDARWVRPSIEGAFKELNYSGPVSITAYGDQTQTPGHVLRGLSSTGVTVAHTRSESTCSLMYDDMVEWRGHNPPPATMMIISNQVKDVFSWDLVRLQQRTKYNLFLAYSISPRAMLVLETSAEWLWENLLDNNKVETRSAPPHKCSETSAMLYCKSCNFDAQSPLKFRKHLSSYNHARQESVFPTSTELYCVTETWGRHYPATPEYATAKILVWWDMFDCPIPEGYDARRVRPSLEAAFESLGYSGPVSITAFGDLNQNQTPDHHVRGLASTGVDFVHSIFDYAAMYSDMMDWDSRVTRDSDNPHQPTNIMVISNDLYPVFSTCLVHMLQWRKYNLFLAYSYRPNHKLSVLLTAAEWLWESLLAVPETTRHVLHKCSTVSETRGHVLQKCSGSETVSACASTAMFYCRMCFFYGKGPVYKSLDDFRTHLSSREHAQEVNRIAGSLYDKRQIQEQRLSSLAQYDHEHREQWRESKRKRTAFRTGFRHLDDHLRLANRRRARKSQSCKKDT